VVERVKSYWYEWLFAFAVGFGLAVVSGSLVEYLVSALALAIGGFFLFYKLPEAKKLAEEKLSAEIEKLDLAAEKYRREKPYREKCADQTLSKKIATLRKAEKLLIAQDVIRLVDLKQFRLAVSPF